ncbi:hypothetical protein [Helicobacter cetorum]|uniref:hypothetical protein n=1 Tax=Helicobacter cetorum TaxID=138563 RepID=UPI000302810E|nr:hypothetical protein [Helicobacter cetorum]
MLEPKIAYSKYDPKLMTKKDIMKNAKSVSIYIVGIVYLQLFYTIDLFKQISDCSPY